MLLFSLLAAWASPLISTAGPIEAAERVAGERTTAQDAWSAALDSYEALQKQDPKRKQFARHFEAIEAANQARNAARWASASSLLTFAAMDGFCENARDPACPAHSERRTALDASLAALESRHAETVGAFLKPLESPKPVTLMHPDVLSGPRAAERVHRGWIPYCAPDDLRARGKAILDPTALPEWLTEKGVAQADVERTIDDLRGFVIRWYEGVERAGDGSLAKHEVCVGLYDDTSGPNSFASGGIWLYVGLRDLETMVGVHQAGIPAAVEYTMGHEFGHILQQTTGMRFEGPTVREAELHADCIAGYLMAVDRGPTFASVSQHYARTEVHRIGDTDTTNPQHHGTPEERQKAFDRGWSAGLIALQGGSGLRQSGGVLTACTLFAAAP